MKVYRLEKDGVGPYRKRWSGKDEDFCRQLCEAHSNIDEHPCWYFEFDNHFTEEHRSGCDSIESLQRWFGKFYEPILSKGFSLMEYEAKKYEKSCRQVVFIPSGKGKKIK
jgi:hypothetical protein